MFRRNFLKSPKAQRDPGEQLGVSTDRQTTAFSY